MQLHAENRVAGWWPEGEPTREMCAVKIALIHSEISEALEGIRKGINDTHLTHRSMAEVEIADAIIRMLDLAGAMNMDLDGAFQEKLAYNKVRTDHKKEARDGKNGKAF